MTQAQVLKALKGEAVRRPDPKNSLDRGISTVVIPHYEIQGGDFEVSFWFTSDRLAEVSLDANSFKGEPVVVYLAIEQMLQSKYGPPSNEHKDPPGQTMTIWHAQWNFKSTAIVMNRVKVTTNPDNLSIRYRGTPKGVAKL
jgi:hypothetical protein